MGARRFICSMMAATLLASCASSMSLMPTASPGQKLQWINGQPVVFSVGANVVGLRIPSTLVESGKPAQVGITVTNATNREFDFSTDNISASSSGARLKVYSFDELLADESRKQSIQRFGLALQAAGAAMSGGTSEGTVSGTYNSGATSGTYVGTVRIEDPAAAAQAQANVDRQISRFNADSAASIARLERTALKRHTVAAGTTHSGLVNIALPPSTSRPQTIELVVLVPPDRHTFAIDIRPHSGQ